MIQVRKSVSLSIAIILTLVLFTGCGTSIVTTTSPVISQSTSTSTTASLTTVQTSSTGTTPSLTGTTPGGTTMVESIFVSEPRTVSPAYLTVVQGDWLYYVCLPADPLLSNWEIHQIKVDGTGDVKLIDLTTKPANLSVSGDWIYYGMLATPGGGIFKIKTDGSGQTKIHDQAMGPLMIEGDWIYMHDVDRDSGLYRLKTDGREFSQLTNRSAYVGFVSNKWLYYFDEKGYYRIKVDGTGQTEVADLGSIKPGSLLAGEWAFEFDAVSLAFKRIRIDGKGSVQTIKIPMTDGQIQGFKVTNDWIYYNLVFSEKDSYRKELHRIKTDGTVEAKISDEPINYFVKYGDWIYYVPVREPDGKTVVKRMKIDGSDATDIVTIMVERP